MYKNVFQISKVYSLIHTNFAQNEAIIFLSKICMYEIRDYKLLKFNILFKKHCIFFLYMLSIFHVFLAWAIYFTCKKSASKVHRSRQEGERLIL